MGKIWSTLKGGVLYLRLITTRQGRYMLRCNNNMCNGYYKKAHISQIPAYQEAFEWMLQEFKGESYAKLIDAPRERGGGYLTKVANLANDKGIDTAYLIAMYEQYAAAPHAKAIYLNCWPQKVFFCDYVKEREKIEHDFHSTEGLLSLELLANKVTYCYLHDPAKIMENIQEILQKRYPEATDKAAGEE